MITEDLKVGDIIYYEISAYQHLLLFRDYPRWGRYGQHHRATNIWKQGVIGSIKTDIIEFKVNLKDGMSYVTWSISKEYIHKLRLTKPEKFIKNPLSRWRNL